MMNGTAIIAPENKLFEELCSLHGYDPFLKKLLI